MVADYGWRAPAWSGAETYRVLYDEWERLLFACALLEEGLPALEGRVEAARRRTTPPGALPEWECLVRGARDFIHKTQTMAAAERTAIEACHDATDAQREALSVGMKVLDLYGLRRERMATLIGHREDPARIRTWLKRVLATRPPRPDAAEMLEQLRALAGQRARALEVLSAGPSPSEDLDALVDHENEGIDLYRALYAQVPLRPRWVPRAAPGEPDRGRFSLTSTALLYAFHVVRVVAEADTRLARGTPASPRSLRQSILDKRRHLVGVLEKVATAAALRARCLAAAHAELDLYELCLDTVDRFGLPVRVVEETRDMAVDVLAALLDREEPEARQAQHRVAALLAIPELGYELPRAVLFSRDDTRLALELSVDLVHVDRARARGEG